MSGPDPLTTPPLAISSAEAAAVTASLYGVEGEATRLDGERDSNFLISADDGEFSLKIFNPAESAAVAEMQQLALLHVAQSDPDLPVPRPVATSDGALVGTTRHEGRSANVRLLSWLQGQRIPVGYSSPGLRRGLGSLAARLDRALRGFTHPADERDYLWDVARLPRLRPLVSGLEADKKALAARILDGFDSRVAPRLTGVSRQVIHSDLNPDNLLVADDPDSIAGIIDFSDVVRTPRIIEPAIAAAYQCLGQDDPVTVIAEVLAAYHAELPLTDTELGVAPDLVMARHVQTMTIGSWHAEIQPENRDYLLGDVEPATEALRLLGARDPDVVGAAITDACEVGR